jgi:RNA polymerase sigma factor (sigma-70 family)
MLLALRRLPARQREVIVLRVFLDLDIESTARQLEIAPGTVRAHLSRAITALRTELALETTTEADPSCPTTIS